MKKVVMNCLHVVFAAAHLANYAHALQHKWIDKTEKQTKNTL